MRSNAKQCEAMKSLAPFLAVFKKKNKKIFLSPLTGNTICITLLFNVNEKKNKQEQNMKTLWFVKSGPDKSHLWDNATFSTLKEAKAYASNLRKTPLGAERPYIIECAKYAKSEVYGDVVSIVEYASNF